VKVCYVTMTFPAPYETFACSDVRALIRAGTAVYVKTLRSARRDAGRLLEEQHLQRLPMSHNSVRAMMRGLGYALLHPVVSAALLVWLIRFSWRRPGQLARSLAISPRGLDILRELTTEPPDVVHLFWGHYPSIVGYLVRRQLPDVVVSMFLGAYDLEARYGPSAGAARAADVVWTHARANVPTLEHLGIRPDRIRVRHRGLEVERFASARQPRIAGRIVAIGRLAAEKTTADALAVFAGVLPRHPAATLVVIGDGPERSELETLAEKLGITHAVTFTGRVPQDEVRDELARAEVLLYMARSDTDRLPNVIKEAMAAQCLCVVTRTRAVEELLEDEVHGFIVRRGDVRGATAKVNWALANPTSARTIGSAGLAHIRAHFDVDDAMREHAKHWTALVRSRMRMPDARSVEAHDAARTPAPEANRPVESMTAGTSPIPKS